MAAKLIALVVPLGLDTFAVAAALGVSGVVGAQRARVSLLMTGFEAGMPLVGLALGAPLGRAIGPAADYVAIAVLASFGLYVLAGRRDDDEDERVARLAGMTGGWQMLLLGLSISLDELAVGFTLGLLRLPVALVIVLVAVQAFVLSQLGMRFGARLSERVREGTERVAGLALVGLAVALIAEKLVG